jgi:hypothetical protein
VQRWSKVAWMPAAFAALALAGCGGGKASTSTNDTATFKAGLSPVAIQLRETAKGMASAIQRAPSQTDAQIGASFGQLASEWQAELSQLETLKPPSNLATDYNTLTDGARRVESDLNAVVAAAHTDSTSAAEQASASLVTDLLSAKAASTKLTDQLGIK